MKMTTMQASGTKMNNEPTEEMQYTIYCDLDGVLADFHSAVTKVMRDMGVEEESIELAKHGHDKDARSVAWRTLYDYQKKYGYVLWRNLDLMPDAYDTWNYIKKYAPQILTATGQERYHSSEQKRGWVTEHFGSNIHINFVPTAANKQKYADPTRILIDDQSKAIDPWRAAGGIGIHHTSAANTIQELKKLGL